MRYSLPSLDVSLTETTLTTLYQTVFLHTADAGLLDSLELNFSKKGWCIKLFIDDLECFELDEETLNKFAYTNEASLKGKAIYLKNNGKDLFYNCVNKPFFNIKVEIKAKKVTNTIKCLRQRINYLREVRS